MAFNPCRIETNQHQPHEDIPALVARYQTHENKRPYAQHTKDAIQLVLSWLDDWSGDVIIDACCGVGESTAILAQQYPMARVIGVDKSQARLAKHAHYAPTQHDNYRIIQADLHDFWRLLASAKTNYAWNISKQCLFYPNPYPKKTQVQKRWHASASFMPMLACSSNIELRSNWKIYVEEFQIALRLVNIDSNIAPIPNTTAITPFERKYSLAGQQCWQLLTN